MFLSRPLSSLVLLLTLVLAACTPVSVEDYADNRPLLVPEKFFQGQLTAHGVIKNRGGEVTRYFNVDLNGRWENGIGTLEEEFKFNDGEVQRRVWTLTPQGEGRYTGTAGDVVGEADITVAGNSMFLDYVLRVPYGDGTIDLRIDDRMYLVNPDKLINESVMSKFGFNVGEILLVIAKQEG
ncbi:DUF3833 domain-containing protein [Kineobactrum sediminis]|uniref:DUF3833 domain-containing protein n=1 Tax=Kineobactrum sediminis TaxID=1905677 RepID=A0A2N5Y2N0_9GAMM|nr:DUF3833 domain-containing protein [Kineobactrum sediminis]PLW82653.1 DUF3833 domain-containing protein [Kineobactrum sediminis]